MTTHTTNTSGTATNKRFHTRNGIATENRVKLVALLNQFLNLGTEFKRGV